MAIKQCAAGLILRDREVLLGLRAADREAWPGVWDLIGGRCEENEAPEQVLIREFAEEIGVTPTEFPHFATIKDPASPSQTDYMFLVYLVTEWTGFPRKVQLHEHPEIRWFPLTEALQLENLALPDYTALFRSIDFCRAMLT